MLSGEIAQKISNIIIITIFLRAHSNEQILFTGMFPHRTHLSSESTDETRIVSCSMTQQVGTTEDLNHSPLYPETDVLSTRPI